VKILTSVTGKETLAPPGPGALIIGSTSGLAGSGVKVGDTEILRKSANVLSCNQLDQTVAPVKTGFENLELGNAGIAASAGASGNFTTFTMPFKGDLAVTGYFVLFASAVVGVCVSTCRFYLASIATGNQVLFRTGGSTANEIWTLPMMIHKTGIASGTSITVQYEALNQGSQSIGMVRVGMMWTATRIL